MPRSTARPPARASTRALWALLEQFAWPIALLVCVPLLMPRLGASDFGFFSLTLTVCGMSSLLSIGVGAITSRNVAMAEEAGDRAGALLDVRRALGALLVCGGTLGVLLATLSPALASSILSGMGHTGLTTRALLAGLVCAAFQEIDTVFSMAVKGLGRFRLAAILEWSGRIVWAVAAVAAAAEGGLMTVLLATILALGFKCLLKAVAACVVFDTARVVVPHVTPHAMRSLLSASRWLWVQNLSALLLLSGDRLIVGALFGSASLGRYTACAQLAQFAFIVPATAGQALLPWVARHLANESEPRVGWRTRLCVLGIASAAGGLVMAVSSGPILSLWLGPEFGAENARLLSALAFGGALLAFSVPFHFVQLAIGRVRMIGVANALGAVACVGLCLLVAPFGLVAFAVAKSVYAVPLLSYGFMLPARRSPSSLQNPSF